MLHPEVEALMRKTDCNLMVAQAELLSILTRLALEQFDFTVDAESSDHE